MPELPEVETMRRGILPIVGGTVAAFHRLPCPRRPIDVSPSPTRISRTLRGQPVTAVERRGKRVAVRFASDHRLIFEPRMTGLVLLDRPPTTVHCRARLLLTGTDAASLVYWDRRGLGSIRLLTADEYERRLGPPLLGIDALTITPRQLQDALAPSRRAVKVALLDQKAVAGVGNLYASELLHLARVHPEKSCRDLTARTWSKIHSAMIEVLEEAILHEGSTLSDGTYRTALNQEGNYQNQHRVYDRAGEPCPRCRRSLIHRIVQAGRSTFFCPKCQK